MSLTAFHGCRVTQDWVLALPEGQITHTSVTTLASSSPRSSLEVLQQRMDVWGHSLTWFLTSYLKELTRKLFFLYLTEKEKLEKHACFEKTIRKKKISLRGWLSDNLSHHSLEAAYITAHSSTPVLDNLHAEIFHRKHIWEIIQQFHFSVGVSCILRCI